MVVVVAIVTTPLTVAARANRQAITSAASAAGGAASVPISAAAPIGIPSTAVAAPAPRDSAALVAALQQLVAGSGVTVGVTVVELGGLDPLTWSLDQSTVFAAASTYKLAALMLEALNI